MENNIISIEEAFDRMEGRTVRKSKPSVALSVLLIAAGILLTVLNGQVAKSPGSVIPTLFILCGIIFLACGVSYAFFRKTKYKFTGDGKNISFSEMLFDIRERERLVRILDEGNMQELGKLKPATVDTLKLRIAATPDGSFCYTQVMTYVPYEFVNVNEARKHSREEAGLILNLQKQRM
jgi:hypothetical protein